MSIFKKIKSAFVIEEAKNTDNLASEAPDSQPDIQPMQEAVNADLEEGEQYETKEGRVNQKFTNILLKAMEAQNQAGFDYIEFKQSIQNLFKMDMDESTVYKSAYATAQTLGATPDNLVSSAQHYLAVLKKEEDKFNAALISQRKKQVEGGLGEVKIYEQSIQDKQNQIEKLKKEVEESKAKLIKMKGEVEEANQKIEATRQDFVASYGNLVSQIKQDVENIGKYLK